MRSRMGRGRLQLCQEALMDLSNLLDVVVDLGSSIENRKDLGVVDQQKTS